MTAVSVSFDGTRIDAADVVGNWNILDTTTKAILNNDLQYQNTGCISRKLAKTSITGVEYEAGSTVDYVTTPKIFLAKVLITTPGALNVLGATGASIRIGSDQSNYYLYYVEGSDTYPAKGGYRFIPIDPNVTGYWSATVGSPALGAVDYYAFQGQVTATSLADNLAVDAIDYFDSGTGLTLVSGDGGDADGAFASFVLEDEGTFDTGRWAVVVTGDAEIVVRGVLTIGTATATVFTDSNQVIVFPDGRVNAGALGINFGLQSASTVITVSNTQFSGLGLPTGSADTRPDYSVTDTSGSLSLDACTFSVYRDISLTSGATVAGCTMLDGYLIDQAGATLTGCNISGATTIDGEAAVRSDDPELITDCTFVFSNGHAMVLTATGTYGFDANVFTGYGLDNSLDAAILNDSGGLVTLNVTNASLPTVRNGEGSTTALNVSVDIEINGVTEGTRIVMIGNGGAEDGVTLLSGYADDTGTVSGTFGGTTPQVVVVRARNSGIINAAVLHDEGGLDTDYTDAARESTGTNDVILLPAVPAIDDAFYYGGIAPFGQLLINVTTAGDTYVLTWEYWNGAWIALTVVDSSSSYYSLGWHKVTFTAPSDWATTTFATLGPFYYVRARVTSGGGTQPKAQNITLNNTVKYLPFTSPGSIQPSSGLTSTAVWIEDVNNP